MIYVIIFISIIICDQTLKFYFNKKLKLGDFQEVVKDKFYFANVRNTGAAYGMLNKNPVLLKVISIFTILQVCSYFYDVLKQDSSKIMKISLAFILSGGFSNIFDRFKKKFVTDYLYIKIKKAPIFNIADLFIFIGCILIVYKTCSDFIKRK